MSNDNRGPAGEVVWFAYILAAGCVVGFGLFLLGIATSR